MSSNKERCTREQNSLFEQWSKIAVGLGHLKQFEPGNAEYLHGKASAYMWGAELVIFASREEALKRSYKEIVRCRSYPGQPQLLLAKADTLEQIIIPIMRNIPWNDPRNTRRVPCHNSQRYNRTSATENQDTMILRAASMIFKWE